MYWVVSFGKIGKKLLTVMGILILALLIGCSVKAGFAQRTNATAEDGIALPILMYHSVLDDSSRWGKYVVSPQMLENDLRFLRDEGYTTVLFADLQAYVDEGTPLPEKPVIITFDDGYYNNYLYAFPLLKQYGMKAVISPIAYWSDFYSANPDEQNHPLYSHLTWEQMKEMTDSGLVEIQNHSYNMHECTAGKRKGTAIKRGESADAYASALARDLTTAQEKIEEACGKAPAVFVYPFGEMCRQATPVLEQLGLGITVSCEERMNVISRNRECLIKLGRFLRPGTVDNYLPQLWEKYNGTK